MFGSSLEPPELVLTMMIKVNKVPSTNQMSTRLKFENLPGIPGIWIDFLNSRIPLSPLLRNLNALAARADVLTRHAEGIEDWYNQFTNSSGISRGRTVESHLRLQQKGTVAVLTCLSPVLFGGPAFQIFKCLTAVKINEELVRRGFSAVPVCWIRDSATMDLPIESIRLLDSDSELQSLQLQQSVAKEYSPSDVLPEDQLCNLLSRISAAGRDAFDPETLEILAASVQPGTTFVQASARLMTALMEEWGMIVLDPSAPDTRILLQRKAAESPNDRLPEAVVQSAVLPVAIRVMDPCEIQPFVDSLPAFDALKLLPPMAWPQASCTLVDSRSRKILELYDLDLYQLFSGGEAIGRRFRDEMPKQVSAKLLALKNESDRRIARLGAFYPGENGVAKTAAAAREKIGFQLTRLQERFDNACRRRQEMMNRRFNRVCNALAPNGHIQERELAGIQWPLRYSRGVLRSIYEKLDIASSEHQLLFMD